MKCPSCGEEGGNSRFYAESACEPSYYIGVIERCSNGHKFGLKRKAHSRDEYDNTRIYSYHQNRKVNLTPNESK
jgi:hypothetical protein